PSRLRRYRITAASRCRTSRTARPISGLRGRSAGLRRLGRRPLRERARKRQADARPRRLLARRLFGRGGSALLLILEEGRRALAGQPPLDTIAVYTSVL